MKMQASLGFAKVFPPMFQNHNFAKFFTAKVLFYTVFHPTKGIPETAATHLQRWAIILSAYDYVIQYKLTAKHGNADRLSRLPHNVTEQNDKSEDADVVCAIEEQQLDCLLIQACDIQKATTQDPVLSQVYS